MVIERIEQKEGFQNERLESERLLMVPISDKYTEDVFNEFSDDITTFMYPKQANDISETEEFVRKKEEELKQGITLQLVVLEKRGQEFLGCAGLHHTDTKTPELGIWIKKSAHGHGFGKEAMTAVKQWADQNLQYDYILYPVDEKNMASRSIPESMGGQIEREYDETGLAGNKLHLLEYRIYPEARKD